eukprot:3843862-Amphidinium_carterae.1
MESSFQMAFRKRSHLSGLEARWGQCREVQRVVGVEIVPSRYSIAEKALQRLATMQPERFRLSALKPGDCIAMEEHVGSLVRTVEFRCADFFTLGLDLCERSDAI